MENNKPIGKNLIIVKETYLVKDILRFYFFYLSMNINISDKTVKN